MTGVELTRDFYICWNATADDPNEKRLMYWTGFDTKDDAEAFILKHHWHDIAHVEPRSALESTQG